MNYHILGILWFSHNHIVRKYCDTKNLESKQKMTNPKKKMTKTIDKTTTSFDRCALYLLCESSDAWVNPVANSNYVGACRLDTQHLLLVNQQCNMGLHIHCICIRHIVVYFLIFNFRHIHRRKRALSYGKLFLVFFSRTNLSSSVFVIGNSKSYLTARCVFDSHTE